MGAVMCVEQFQLSLVPLRGKSLISNLFSSLDSDIHILSASRSNPLYSLLVPKTLAQLYSPLCLICCKP